MRHSISEGCRKEFLHLEFCCKEAFSKALMCGNVVITGIPAVIRSVSIERM
jgi:phosphopantetheinyl transferase (holo-ACP synthase)